MKLTRSDRKLIKEEAGLIYAKIIRVRRDRHGYPDLLIEAQDNSGFKFRGWWREGEGAIDIRWQTENADGWPENVTYSRSSIAGPAGSLSIPAQEQL